MFHVHLRRMCILLSRKCCISVRSLWTIVLFISAVYWFSFWMIFPLLKGYWFWHVDLINLFFTKLTCFSNYFSVNVLGESWHLIISFAVKDSSTSSFPILRPIIAFFCLIELAYVSNTMINTVQWYEASLSFLYLISDLIGKIFRGSSLGKILIFGEKIYIMYILYTYIHCTIQIICKCMLYIVYMCVK